MNRLTQASVTLKPYRSVAAGSVKDRRFEVGHDDRLRHGIEDRSSRVQVLHAPGHVCLTPKSAVMRCNLPIRRSQNVFGLLHRRISSRSEVISGTRLTASLS